MFIVFNPISFARLAVMRFTCAPVSNKNSVTFVGASSVLISIQNRCSIVNLMGTTPFLIVSCFFGSVFRQSAVSIVKQCLSRDSCGLLESRLFSFLKHPVVGPKGD